MPLQIVRNDILKMRVDAIVNPSDPALSGGGGLDAAIHKAAGPELAEECGKIGSCPPGGAVCTSAGKLKCRYIIHTAGPRWQGGEMGERLQLRSCYMSSLALAAGKGCETVALPLISVGSLGYPKTEALATALEAVADFLAEHELTVYLVVFDRQSFAISEKLFEDISTYIDDNYVEQYHRDHRANYLRNRRMDAAVYSVEAKEMCAPSCCTELEDELEQLDESFQEMLLRLIDRSGMTDAECYKRANIDRRHFSKIRADRLYRPSKPTALAFAVALRLGLEETEELLRKAGFALSRSSKFDVIIKYFISRGSYDIIEINEALFAFDQSLLGS